MLFRVSGAHNHHSLASQLVGQKEEEEQQHKVVVVVTEENVAHFRQARRRFLQLQQQLRMV